MQSVIAKKRTRTTSVRIKKKEQLQWESRKKQFSSILLTIVTILELYSYGD